MMNSCTGIVVGQSWYAGDHSVFAFGGTCDEKYGIIITGKHFPVFTGFSGFNTFYMKYRRIKRWKKFMNF